MLVLALGVVTVGSFIAELETIVGAKDRVEATAMQHGTKSECERARTYEGEGVERACVSDHESTRKRKEICLHL